MPYTNVLANHTYKKSLSLYSYNSFCFAYSFTFFVLDIDDTNDFGNYSSIDFTKLINCIDIVKNGSVARINCSIITAKPTSNECDSIMTPLLVYGATIVIFANIIYLIPYIFVCLLYLFIPGISRRAYDKVVLCFTITQAILSITLISLGHFMLCHKPLSNTSNSFFGITFMTLTISGVLWLLVISFDVSSTITTFRWAPSSGAKGRDENHKFRVYLIWVSAGTIIPTAISTILQFAPIPDDFILKPNFHILNTLNYGVIVHVASVPVLVAICSNALFIYTTIRMIKIQKSTCAANENRKKSVKEKYILYLKLYFLMDAPYITGALGAIFKDLWILKFCRMLQPVLMLYAVLPRGVVTKAFSCKRRAGKPNHQTCGLES